MLHREYVKSSPERRFTSMFSKAVLIGTGTLALMLLLSTGVRASIVIDGFDDNGSISDGTLADGAVRLDISASNGPILGGIRTSTIEKTGHPLATDPTLQTSLITVGCAGSGGNSGCISFNNAVFTTGIASLLYDAGGSGLGDFDLGQGGANNAIVVNQVFGEADVQALLTVTARDIDSQWSVSLPSIADVAGLPGDNLVFRFDDFQQIDFSKLAWLRLDIVSTDFGVDLELDSIVARNEPTTPPLNTPLPAPLVLLASALVATFVMRRPLA